ncbi:hypothetical protein HK099_001534 [Clydaea vesicula]|uniref:N-terminal Ras-GEF domain-containing protein n=1 Tax=Clydaea vesicula TaxID=447962 RepID=A0AAD5TTL1_9FUNG|nr:hypothetical protein HK099_001534 [Clydaea vesicula]
MQQFKAKLKESSNSIEVNGNSRVNSIGSLNGSSNCLTEGKASSTTELTDKQAFSAQVNPNDLDDIDKTVEKKSSDFLGDLNKALDLKNLQSESLSSIEFCQNRQIPQFLSNTELPNIPPSVSGSYQSEFSINLEAVDAFNDSSASLTSPTSETIYSLPVEIQTDKSIRKRTVSTPILKSTFRKHLSPSRKPVVESKQLEKKKSVEGAPDLSSSSSLISSSTTEKKFCLIKYIIQKKNAVVDKAQLNKIEKKILKIYDMNLFMLQILGEICITNNLKLEEYSLKYFCNQQETKISEEDELLEMDRRLFSFLPVNEQNNEAVLDLVVFFGEKKYETVIVCEDEKDVMILRNVKKHQIVMAATSDKLIEKATNCQEKDLEFLDTLFMSFRTFLKPLDFLDILIAKFNSQLPENPTIEDIEFYNKMKYPTQKK